MSTLLVGLTANSGKFHAVASRPTDTRPLGHGHYQHRRALCGASVLPRPWKWSLNRPTNLCKHCVKLTPKEN